MKRQIVNIVNFVRGCEPRQEMDLYTPVREQVKLVNEYGLPSTFLLMYDTLCDGRFAEILKEANGETEFGVWFEVVESQCEAAGVKWRGRPGFPWDYHANAGFTVAYKPEERERLADVLFEKFREVYGEYPRSVGSWAIDAHTYGYLSKKYNVSAACTCRDQWGTDGYTFWGGYYNQAYYPSRYNMFCPAQSREAQIDIPVFRMLGSDPIYQYDMGLDVNGVAADWQGVATLEPVYAGRDGGGNPDWVDWYLDENFSGRCLEFGYTQAGQENSFGWNAMSAGLTYQIGKIAKLRGEGRIEALTLSETGEWFRKTFPQTPATVVSALTDRHGKGRSSVWYDCKNYRADVYTELGAFWIRDVFLFRERYEERYLRAVNDSVSMTFDNLPFIDGNRYSGLGVRAGLYPFVAGKSLTYKNKEYKESGHTAEMLFTGTEAGDFRVVFDEEKIGFYAGRDFEMRSVSKKGADEPEKCAKDKTLTLTYRGFAYTVTVKTGFLKDEDVFISSNGALELVLV